MTLRVTHVTMRNAYAADSQHSSARVSIHSAPMALAEPVRQVVAPRRQRWYEKVAGRPTVTKGSPQGASMKQQNSQAGSKGKRVATRKAVA